MLAVILGNVIIHGAGHISWQFLTEPPREGMTAGGIYPAIVGTLFLVLLMTVAAVPIGVATAVYLTEYAPKITLTQARHHLKDARGMQRLRALEQLFQVMLTQVTRAAVTTLAGVPSIVFGLFGLGFFIHYVGDNLDRNLYAGELVFGKPSVLWAALTLAVLTLPVVIVATEEALRAVPRDVREASLALGATQWQTIRRVVLPQALPGILTGTILAISRGAGEVAPILFTGAAYFLPQLPTRLNDQFMHLGYHVYILSTQSPNIEKTKPILYATVLVLLVLTFSLNLVGVMIRMRIRQQLRAGQ
ncbi:MAG: PstA family ABC transporter permease [Acidobacteriota bacterium]|nr:phosphate ABC transporter permease PstA [Blastocatellia bacterium]MDW8238793.1 PstA family ABC transporter permease [Acidobacteriota bacterium]